jgi:hypothetical protein
MVIFKIIFIINLTNLVYIFIVRGYMVVFILFVLSQSNES